MNSTRLNEWKYLNALNGSGLSLLRGAAAFLSGLAEAEFLDRWPGPFDFAAGESLEVRSAGQCANLRFLKASVLRLECRRGVDGDPCCCGSTRSNSSDVSCGALSSSEDPDAPSTERGARARVVVVEDAWGASATWCGAAGETDWDTKRTSSELSSSASDSDEIWNGSTLDCWLHLPLVIVRLVDEMFTISREDAVFWTTCPGSGACGSDGDRLMLWGCGTSVTLERCPFADKCGSRVIAEVQLN